ncbi:hypothetical protein FHG87_003808 [Trinorchestia longiramus]|nr:hypothetical protein FHG87_003808 [Trinorchestia longiramus]
MLKSGICATCLRHLPASPACATCLRHLPASPACATCLRHLPVPLAYATCLRHLPAPLACATCLHHLPAPLACATCLHRFALTYSSTPFCIDSSVSQSDPYHPPGGVQEMQGGGRRVRLEWGAYIIV